MFFRILINAIIEDILNIFLHTPIVLEPVYQQLYGKVICISLIEFDISIVLMFSKYHINVLGKWNNEVDCYISTYLGLLPILYNCQNFSVSVNDYLKIDGDISIAENFISLINLSAFYLEEVFTPFFGDIFVEGISKFIRYCHINLCRRFLRMQSYITDILTEEWRYAPGSSEVEWFINEVTNVKFNTKVLTEQLEKWRTNDNR